MTYFELDAAATFLEAGIEHKASVPIRVRTWPETRARLATMLPPDELLALARAYIELSVMEETWGVGGARPLSVSALATVRKTLELVETAAGVSTQARMEQARAR